jgi:hypothetical protein
MKKYISLFMVLSLAALTLSGCGGGSAEAAKLSFAESASLETIEGLKGKTVTLTGYMATLSPLEGDYIYLMNLPFQSCPFCVPNTQQLANTMAVYAAKGTKFDYTDRPVKITGKMDVGQYTDDYGYEYNYRLVDATCEIVDLSEVSEDYALYQSLAEDGVIADVNAMFDYLLFTYEWTEYQGQMTDDSGVQVPYYLYPGDAENILADTGVGGYATQSDPNYFPGLIKRVNAVSHAKLKDLTTIIADAAELEAYARQQLAEGHYQYDEAADKYTLDDGQHMSDQFYEVYGRFSEWLTRYQL